MLPTSLPGGKPGGMVTARPTSPPPATAGRAPTSGRATPRTAAPGPQPAPGGPNLAAVRARLSQVATFSQPLAMAVRVGDGALYVAEKTGRVRALRGGTVDPTPILDLS